MKLPKRWRWMVGGGIGIMVVGMMLRPTSIAVETEVVTRGALRTVIAEEAQTRARDEYVVAVPTTGRVTRTRVKAGDHVTRGMVLATVNPAPIDARELAASRAALRAADAQVAPLRAALADAEAAHGMATRELERMRTLLKAGAVSPNAVEQQELNSKSAEANRDRVRGALEAAIAESDAARARLIGATASASGSAAINVLAPSNGTVLRVMQESERVTPAGTPIVTIADAGGAEVVIALLTEDAVNVHVGNPIRLTGWGGDSVLQGEVQRVEPSAFTKVSALGVEEQRVNVIGSLANRPAALGVGFRLQAEVVVWSGENILSVATTAVFRRNDKWYVFAVVNGRAALREIEIGHRGVERVEVLKGITDGERVILFPSDLIAEGVRVTYTAPSGTSP